MSTKVCRKCLFEKPITEFSVTDRLRGYRKARCKTCEAERVRKYYAANEEYREKANANSRKQAETHPRTPEQTRRYGMKQKFGITPEQFAWLLEDQGGCCALCGATSHGRNGQSGRYDGSRDWKEDSWPIDHDHKDGRVRGLLCHPCNVRLGAYETLRDSVGLDKVEAYLSRPSPVRPAPEMPARVYPKHEVAPLLRPRPLCSVERCGRPHFANGLCGMHTMRLRRGGELGPADHLPHQTPGQGAAHPKAKLTDDDVRAIRASTEKGIRLAERYGVTATLISNIRQGKVWKHVVTSTGA